MCTGTVRPSVRVNRWFRKEGGEETDGFFESVTSTTKPREGAQVCD